MGGDFKGTRLNKLYRENVNEEEILKELRPIFKDYSENRIKGEEFGNFVIRKQIVNS